MIQVPEEPPSATQDQSGIKSKPHDSLPTQSTVAEAVAEVHEESLLQPSQKSSGPKNTSQGTARRTKAGAKSGSNAPLNSRYGTAARPN